MRRIIIPLLAICFIVTGCMRNENAKIGSKAEAIDGDFVYRLVSEKSLYAEGERVDLYAELEYVGDKQEIEIAHSASPFYFPIKEKTRGFEIDYMMNQPRIVTILKKGEPLKERYKGGGGYGSEDPKEYVDFIKAVVEASRRDSLPSGEYEVFGRAEFEPLYGSEKKENKNIRLEAKIEFRVVN